MPPNLLSFFPLILLFLLVLQGTAQQPLGSDELIRFNCTSQNKAFLFKTMQTFSILSFTKQDDILLTSHHISCTLQKLHNHICTFQNMTKEINISCPGVAFQTPKYIQLTVKRPSLLANQQTSPEDTNLVHVQLSNGEQGILSLLFNYEIFAEISKLKLATMNTSMLDLFLISDCVNDVVLFGDRFKIAVTKKSHPCVVGIKKYLSSWKFYKTLLEFHPTNTSIIHTGYLQKMSNKTYKLNDRKISLYFVVQSEQIQQMKGLEIQWEFTSINGNKTFNMSNFQKGLPVFDCYVYLDRLYTSLVLRSNYNVFYALYELENVESQVVITEDSYLYTEIVPAGVVQSQHANNHHSFIIELAGFNTQSELSRIILFQTSTNLTFSFTFEQCFTSTCHNSTKVSNVITTSQFAPECLHLIEQMCYVKITVVNTTSSAESIFGILPLTYSENVELKLNVFHQGVLRRQNVLHFVVKKETLMNVISEVLMIGLSGAKIFLTYNPECKKIYCSEYWGVSNTLEIPRVKKDLFIFIEGSMYSHYTLLIDSNDHDNGIHLPQSIPIAHFLSYKQKSRYYLYSPTSSNKSFQISCNTIPNTLLLMVNIRSKTFPTFDNAAYTSKNCYLHINPTSFSSDDLIYITIQRIHSDPAKINYNLMGVTEGNPILGHWREPFHDYFRAQTSKTFKYLMNDPVHDVYLKVDVYEQIDMTPVIVEFGDVSKRVKYTVTVNDTGTFMVDLEKQRRICQEEERGEGSQCYLNVEIWNHGKVGLEVSVTVWERMEPIKLTFGEYENFETGSLGEETHFYLPVDNPNKPINIYVFSNQVEIEVIGQIWNPKQNSPMNLWPFPSFEHLSNETLSHLVYSLSTSLHFSKEMLLNSTPNTMILLTVRDKTKYENRSNSLLMNPGNIQLVVSNGFTTLRQDDKFEYIIGNDELYHFEFPLGNLLELENQEVYFYNLGLSGKGAVGYYFSNQKYQEDKLEFVTEEMVVVKLEEFKKKIREAEAEDADPPVSSKNLHKDQPQTMPKRTISGHHSLSFVVKCIATTFCKFLSSIVSSSSQYRQLTIGVPQQFYIPPHQSAIFQFNDFYNEDFKIKVQRQQGFPEYKIKSCSGVKKIDCITPLLHKQKIVDQSPFILTGRSHELKIDTTSPYYCKSCAYYIMFYAFSEPIYGSLTIARSGQAIILKESVPLTTELYSDNEDSYLISTVPDSERFITIVPHMGKINIELVEVLQSAENKPRIHYENSSGKSNIYLELEKTAVAVPYNLKLRSLDNENIMYTIVLSSKNRLISLADGVPFKTSLEPNSNFKINYEPRYKSTILITATHPIEIKLICQDKNAIQNHNHKIKYSEVLNVSLIHLNSSECKVYIIEITNKNKLTNITILPNDEEILLLPFQIAIPSLVTKNKCQMYEVPIQQKTLIKIVMYICQPGNAILGLSYNKNNMILQKYDRKFTIEGDRYTEVFQYLAVPGILYFQIHSESDSIEYAIEIFPFYKQSEKSQTKISLSDSYIETTPISSDKFRLKFQPYQLSQSGVNYTVNYVIVQSIQRNYLRKSLRCSTTFFDIQNPNTTFKQSYLKLQQTPPNQRYLTAIYQPTYPHSYITIIPVIQPRLESYINKPSYDISQLSTGKGPKFFERSITILMGVIEEVSGIEDEAVLNFIMIVVIVVFNVLIVSCCCLMGARHCRNEIVVEVERKRLASSQREGRVGSGENSLDMLDGREDVTLEKGEKEKEKKEEVV